MKRIAICSGEPAGVGIELCLALTELQHSLKEDCALIILADEMLLRQRAEEMNLPISLITLSQASLDDSQQLHALSTQARINNQLLVLPIHLPAHSTMGELNVQNVPYVLDILQTAHQLCTQQLIDGILTLPIHKGVINQYLQQTNPNTLFHGHTEFFQQATLSEEVVMMLSCEKISVALATTHIPLHQVASSLTREMLEKKLTIIDQHYPHKRPNIAVLGLNPHAGEGGYIGTEELNIIQPTIDKLRQKGMQLSDVLSADTAFISPNLQRFDCFFGMYHDQVLPIIKHLGFHQTTNITLGLPYPRVSVDHGTALDIVGTNKVNHGSLLYSLGTLQQRLTNA